MGGKQTARPISPAWKSMLPSFWGGFAHSLQPNMPESWLSWRALPLSAGVPLFSGHQGPDVWLNEKGSLTGKSLLRALFHGGSGPLPWIIAQLLPSLSKAEACCKMWQERTEERGHSLEIQVPGGLFPEASFEDDVYRNTYMGGGVGTARNKEIKKNDYTWMFGEERT